MIGCIDFTGRDIFRSDTIKMGRSLVLTKLMIMTGVVLLVKREENVSPKDF